MGKKIASALLFIVLAAPGTVTPADHQPVCRAGVCVLPEQTLILMLDYIEVLQIDAAKPRTECTIPAIEKKSTAARRITA